LGRVGGKFSVLGPGKEKFISCFLYTCEYYPKYAFPLPGAPFQYFGYLLISKCSDHDNKVKIISCFKENGNCPLHCRAYSGLEHQRGKGRVGQNGKKTPDQ
jgi:hypothetical protein